MGIFVVAALSPVRESYSWISSCVCRLLVKASAVLVTPSGPLHFYAVVISDRSIFGFRKVAMLDNLKARYWDVKLNIDDRSHVTFVELEKPLLRRSAIFLASEWKFFTGVALTIIGIIVSYIVG